MNPEQLWETTMNPETRILKQVNIENAAEADYIFSMLMGDDVGPRREFIEKMRRMQISTHNLIFNSLLLNPSSHLTRGNLRSRKDIRRFFICMNP